MISSRLCLSSAIALLPFAQAVAAEERTVVLDTVVVDGEGAPAEGAGAKGYASGRTRGYQPVTTSLGLGTDASILDIPQAVAVVSQEVLNDQQSRSLEEVLWNVSGVTQTNSLGGTQDAFLRRGFGDNRDGGVLTDGLKTALPRSFNATTERVEVLKGPSSALYGILDPGGLINVVTKKPQYDFSGRVEAWLTSFGGGGASSDVTGPVGQTGLAYRLVTEYEDTDYWRNFGEIERKLLAPSFAYETDTTRIDVSYMQESYSVPFDRGTIFDLTSNRAVDVDPKTRFDELYNATDGSSDLATAALTHELNEDWTLRVNYAYSDNTYYDNQARVTAYNAATGILTRRADATQNSQIEQHSMRADTVGRVTTGDVEHELLFGASFDDSDLLRTNLIRGPTSRRFNIKDPVYGLLPTSNAVSAVDSDQTERTRTYSFYGQDSLHLGERWILIGGLRYQQYEQTAGKGRPFLLNTDQSDGEFAPRAGLVYKVRPDLSVYANWSRSFKPNSSIASEIGALPAETGESYEAGVKYQLATGITATAALYTIDKENVLYSEIVNGETRTTTAGAVGSRGFEFDLAGQVTDELDLIATYAYTDARVKEDPVLDGKRLTNVAGHSGSLFLAYDFSSFVDLGTLRAGIGGRYVGKRPGNAANTFDLPDYTVLDAFVSYAVPVRDQTLTLQLNVKNLADEVYYASSIGTNNLGVEIGEPLEAVFTARVDF
ncbi:TonB-dependent siderophore receptor [Aureimonas pseudogalii]|uniref:Iron complex outermembrane receptor protein n=1 Tax=Aureimonas pseudogalii TaxID=1744844 RepID=A0A7W6H892_9HYPH|nr:TonB-dependent siderophore receptor [Aureimonas pseudogalii]MBB4000241.1 iron complex outermembrane receptor protein [Aureimonas pseudogalii]